MLKIVVDTNVVISGIFFRGTPGKIIDGIAENQYQLILSKNIIDEYLEVVIRYSKKQKMPEKPSLDIVNFLISNSLIIDAGNIPTPPCSDPDDIMFLQAAIAPQKQNIWFRETNIY